MSDDAATHISLDPDSRSVLIRCEGPCRARRCLPIRGYLESLAPGKVEATYFDLSSTVSIDSTFAGFLLDLHKRKTANGERFILVCPTEAVTNTFELMGVDKMFVKANKLPTPSTSWTPLPADVDSEEMLRQIIVEAHEQLMSVNERNREVFGPVVDGFRKAGGQ